MATGFSFLNKWITAVLCTQPNFISPYNSPSLRRAVPCFRAHPLTFKSHLPPRVSGGIFHVRRERASERAVSLGLGHPRSLHPAQQGNSAKVGDPWSSSRKGFPHRLQLAEVSLCAQGLGQKPKGLQKECFSGSPGTGVSY